MLLIARESRSVEQRKSESPIVEKAVAEIRRQYSKAVTLEAVAAACFVSKEHLSRTFKKETGFGFSEYLNLYRLKRADMLLRERRDMRVVDVAMQCGFNDSNYFSKVYKKMFGVSPKQAQKEKNDV
jgi:transcriptional regulator GlxA family with amidase domain